MISAPVRVLLAEDHELVRAGITALLGRLPGIEVVGGACDGREALELMASTTPDVVLMDLTMPGLGGLQTLTRDLNAAIVIDAATRRGARYVAADFVHHEGVVIRGRAEPQELYALPLPRTT